jgi:hypothetical protein
MDVTFQIVYSLLKWIAEITGLTYNEVNIIAYYIVSSVLICVVFPAIVFVVMFHFAYPKFFRKMLRHLSSAGDSPQKETS